MGICGASVNKNDILEKKKVQAVYKANDEAGQPLLQEKAGGATHPPVSPKEKNKYFELAVAEPFFVVSQEELEEEFVHLKCVRHRKIC